MENIFVCNGKTYTAKPIDFELICDLEDYGLDIEALGDKPAKSVAIYLMLCGNFPDEKSARKEIRTMDDINAIGEAFSKEIEKSDFFRITEQTTETKTATTQSKKKAKA